MMAGIAKDRHATMLAQAERDRLVVQARRAARAARKAARQARPGPDGRPVILRDGSRVLIRPVRRSDAPLLAEGFSRLSDRSRWLRFLTAKTDLSPAELSYFTSVDHHDHEALGAVARTDGRGVGIARYIRRLGEPSAAEIAITVIDDWQGKGLCGELLAQLSDRACQEGISRFVALVAADNAAMAGLLDNMKGEVVHREFGTLTYELTLGCAQSSGLGCGALSASEA